MKNPPLRNKDVGCKMQQFAKIKAGCMIVASSWFIIYPILLLVRFGEIPLIFDTLVLLVLYLHGEFLSFFLGSSRRGYPPAAVMRRIFATAVQRLVPIQQAVGDLWEPFWRISGRFLGMVSGVGYAWTCWMVWEARVNYIEYLTRIDGSGTLMGLP